MLQKRVVFQAKVFFSNSWFIFRFRSLRRLLLLFCFWVHNKLRILWAISRITFRKHCHKYLKKFPRQLILIRDEKIWEKIINWNVDMDCRWTTLRIHLWVWNVQTHVKLFCCGSAQMIMKIDFQQIIIF